MKSSKKLCALVIAAALAGAYTASADVIVTQWSFTSAAAAPDNSPAPSSGSGTAVVLGMGSTASVASADVLATAGTAHSSFTEDTWRIRGAAGSTAGATNTYPANGWANAAPNYTQGAAFEIPTTGYVPTNFSFDWYSTTQGVGNLQVRYTLNDTAGSGINATTGVADPSIVWSNLGSDLLATSNDYYGAVGSSPTNSISLAGLPSGAANDPNFAIELVSVKPVPGDADYSATGPGGDGNYASAAGDTSSATAVDYNNNSGNWRFDNITLSGTSVPEPASAALLGVAALSLLNRRRNHKVS